MRPASQEVSLPDEQVASVAFYKKMYDRVSELGRIGVWECDLANDALTWTEAVYDLFEIARGAPIKRADIVLMYEPESRERLERIRSEAILRGTGFELEAMITTGQGNQRWIRIIADIEQENGRSVRIFGTKQDITRERATQDQLCGLQTELVHVARVNAMSAMASTLAHELNQPLTAIANYLIAARRMAPEFGIEDLSVCVDGARDSALRAGEIIRRLRDMTVRGQPRREAFTMKIAVDEAVALAAGGRPELRFVCEVDPLIRMVGDRIQIQQVLLNLIQNSYEATDGAGCEVRIEVAEHDGEIELRVTDNGPGIPAGILPNVFDSLVTTKDEGMGIGLSVTRTIIEMHGGRITICNNGGGGASICIALPVDGIGSEA